MTDRLAQLPHDLTGFQRDLLVIVAFHESVHGLGIKEALEEAYGTEINHGRLYPNLDTLVEKGLLIKHEYRVDDRTHEYEVSDRGMRVLSGQFNVLTHAVDD